MRYCLIFLWLGLGICPAQVLPADEADAVLEQLMARVGNRPLTVRYQETKKLPLLQKPVAETGTLYRSAEGKFRRQPDDPKAALTVFDGSQLWIYYPNFQEAEVYDLTQQSALREMILAVSGFLPAAEVKRQFRVEISRREEGGYHVVLRPRSSRLRSAFAVLTLAFDATPRLLASTLEGKDGTRIETRFTEETFSMPDPQLFRFTPPPNTTVTDPFRGIR